MNADQRPVFRKGSIPLAIALLAFAFAACGEPPSGPAATDAPGATRLRLASALFSGCRSGVQPGGALYEVCVPEDWNGDLAVWAHGYVSATEPLAVPDDEVDGQPLSEVITDLGYAYAASSYRKNGLAAAEAVDDLSELVQVVSAEHGLDPRHVYLTGASEGGLATALSIERDAAPFDGGMAACGPIGNFRKQINHFGDFRVVFDYFFPDVMPGTAVAIPPELVSNAIWDNVYEPAIGEAIAADPHATRQLLDVTGAATDANDPASVEQTVVGLLWYSFFATNDARATLGGNPYDNRFRRYRGSEDDGALNAGVDRFRADPAALATLEAYETDGSLGIPAVTLHTTGDPIVPYWHEPLYIIKTFKAGAGRNLTSLPVDRYGHCQFTEAEVLAAFAVLVLRVSGADLVVSAEALPDPASQREFLALARRGGADPRIAQSLRR